MPDYDRREGLDDAPRGLTALAVESANRPCDRFRESRVCLDQPFRRLLLRKPSLRR